MFRSLYYAHHMDSCRLVYSLLYNEFLNSIFSKLFKTTKNFHDCIFIEFKRSKYLKASIFIIMSMFRNTFSVGRRSSLGQRHDSEPV